MSEHNGENNPHGHQVSAKDAVASGSSVAELTPRPNGETRETQFEAAIERLADRTFERNRPADHALLLKQTAKAKKVNVAAIRAEMRLRRARVKAGENVDGTTSPNAVAIEPIDGAVLLDDLLTMIRRHLHLPQHGDVVIALWVVFTHAHSAFRHSPRMVFTAPVENCGKTTGLKVLNKACRRPHLTSHTTVAAMFRRINDEQPTMLIDEAENYVAGPDYVGLINSGHDRDGATYDRCEKNAQGAHTAATYKTWGPLALARVGAIQPATLRSRCIIVNMQRAKPNERPEPLHRTSGAAWQDLQTRAGRWAQQNLEMLRQSEPEMAGLDNRAADNWRPLLAIADAVGGHWPKLARDAAAALAEARKQSPVEELLAAIRRAFDQASAEGLTSVELCEALAGDEDFTDAASYAAISETWAGRALSKRLEPFAIKAIQWRDPCTKRNVRGFRHQQFEDVFDRYLPEVARGDTPDNQNNK